MTDHTVRLVLRSGVALERQMNETDFREVEEGFVAKVRGHSREHLLVFGEGHCLIDITEVAVLTWDQGNDTILPSPTAQGPADG